MFLKVFSFSFLFSFFSFTSLYSFSNYRVFQICKSNFFLCFLFFLLNFFKSSFFSFSFFSFFFNFFGCYFEIFNWFLLKWLISFYFTKCCLNCVLNLWLWRSRWFFNLCWNFSCFSFSFDFFRFILRKNRAHWFWWGSNRFFFQFISFKRCCWESFWFFCYWFWFFSFSFWFLIIFFFGFFNFLKFRLLRNWRSCYRSSSRWILRI